MKDNALYLEVDEDITSAIDKLQKMSASSVQIVVPKRSTMLQSVINLKLLKKAAADSGKELALVTNDRVATDLAGRIGLAVATSLGARAVLAEPKAPEPEAVEDIIEADEPEPPRPVEPEAKPAAEAPKSAAKRPLFARRQLDDKPAPASAAVSAAAGAATDSGDKAGPTSAAPKVPNFNRLQRRLLWAGGAAALIIAYFAAMYFLSSAKVTLYAIANKVGIDLTFAVDPNLKQTDIAKSVLAGQTVTFSKDVSAPFTPSGKKDVGTKAAGSVAFYNSYDTNPHTYVAGTQLVAPDGKVFRTTADVVVPAASVTLVGGTPVVSPGKSGDVGVQADANGDGYNEAPARYAIKNLSGDQQAKIYAQGGQMSGGTSKTVTIVTQADVDKAKTEALAKDKEASERDLEGRVPSGYVALKGSQQQRADNVTSTPAVEQEATTATITLKLIYTQLAVKKTEYQDLVRMQEQKQIGSQNQIYDDGIDSAQLTAENAEASGRQSFHFTTDAYGGAKLNQADIASQLKGERYGDAAETASKLPGVQRAEISLWPVWNTKLPARASQIKVTIQVSDKKGE